MHVERAADLYTMAMFVYKAAMCKPSGIPLTPPHPRFPGAHTLCPAFRSHRPLCESPRTCL